MSLLERNVCSTSHLFKFRKVSRSVASGNTLGGLLDFGARGGSVFEAPFVVLGRVDCGTEGLGFFGPPTLVSGGVTSDGMTSE